MSGISNFTLSKNPETRARLVASALTLFDQVGYDETTTTQIAEAAGVSQRTFFRYFPTKLDVLVSDIPAQTDHFATCLRQQPSEYDLGTALLSAIGEFEQSHPLDETQQIRGRIIRSTPSLANAIRRIEGDLEIVFAEWIAHRYQREAGDFDVRVVAAVLVAARRVVMTEWQSVGITTSSIALARRAVENIEIHLAPAASGKSCRCKQGKTLPSA